MTINVAVRSDKTRVLLNGIERFFILLECFVYRDRLPPTIRAEFSARLKFTGKLGLDHVLTWITDFCLGEIGPKRSLIPAFFDTGQENYDIVMKRPSRFCELRPDPTSMFIPKCRPFVPKQLRSTTGPWFGSVIRSPIILNGKSTPAVLHPARTPPFS